MKKKTRNRIIGGVIACVCIFSALGLAVYLWPKPDSGVNPNIPVGGLTDDNFIVAEDGVRGDELDERDIVTAEWRLPVGEDDEDWGEWEQNTDVTDMSDVELDDFTSDYSRVVLIFSCAAGTDAGNDEAVVYYQRQAEIFDDRVNTIYLYETPNAGAGFGILNSNTLAVIDHAGATNITINMNFTVVSFINITQSKAKYEAYWDFTANQMARLEMVFTFNATVASSDLVSKSGLIKTRPSTVTLSFGWNSLGVSGAIHRYEWGASPTADICINSEDIDIVLQFNGVTI